MVWGKTGHIRSKNEKRVFCLSIVGFSEIPRVLCEIEKRGRNIVCRRHACWPHQRSALASSQRDPRRLPEAVLASGTALLARYLLAGKKAVGSFSRKCKDLVALNVGEPVEEDVDEIIRLQVLKQALHRHPRSCKNRLSAEHFRMVRDYGGHVDGASLTPALRFARPRRFQSGLKVQQVLQCWKSAGQHTYQQCSGYTDKPAGLTPGWGYRPDAHHWRRALS